MHEGPGSFKGQRAAYRTNLPQMVKTRATYTAHMPGKGQFLVQGPPQVPPSSGKQDPREAFQQDGKINFGQLHTATNPDELCLPNGSLTLPGPFPTALIGHQPFRWLFRSRSSITYLTTKSS